VENKLLRLLVIDDSPDDAELATAALRHAGYRVKSQRVQDLGGAQAALAKGDWDVVIGEIDVPQLSVPSMLELLKRLKLDLPVIVMTRTVSDEELTTLIRNGARDVVFKNQTGRLAPVIEREIEASEARRAHQQAQQAYTDLEHKYRALIQGSHEAVGYLQDGMHVEANPAYLALFGYDNLQALQEIPVLNLIDVPDQARFKALMRKPGQDPTGSAGSFTIVKRDGTRAPVEIALSMIDMGGESWMQLSVTDMSRHKNIEDRLQFLNQHDPLTGLHNRHHFLHELGKAVEAAKSGQGTSALLYIDLEQLKVVNNAHGFAAGDRMLIKLARLFRDHVGKQDVLARFAGDEFAVLMPDADAKRAAATAEAIKKAMRETSFTEGGKHYQCGCSLNIVVIDRDTESVQKAVLSAHRHTAAKPPAPPPAPASAPPPPPAAPLAVVEPAGPAAKVSPWAITIDNALQHDGFQLLYQPIVNLHGDPAESYEVLLRLQGEEPGKSSVGELLRGAVACGKAQAIDHWVVRHAIAALGEHRKTGAQTSFFINLTDAALRDETLALLVLQEIKGTGLKADSLVFEITESALADSPRDAAAFIASLRKLGCRFCVDDFGDRLSAFPEIQKLPIEFLKLNGRLIANLTNDPVAQTVVQALFQVAKTMQKRIIAKFVEDAESLALLWNYGADYVQGNYFQPPDAGLTYEFTGESIDSDQAVGGWTQRR